MEFNTLVLAMIPLTHNLLQFFEWDTPKDQQPLMKSEWVLANHCETLTLYLGLFILHFYHAISLGLFSFLAKFYFFLIRF